jgi:molybdenum cofactor biosynthesis enzyme MoaA
LLPHLEDWVRLAREAGAGTVEIQTNATRIDRARARSLKAAGADLLFVSLHGSCAEISDAVTKAPGTFDQTLAGLDAAVGCELRVRVNFVFCEPNRADFPAFVDLLTTRYPSAELCVSFVAPSTDMVPRSADLIPRYSDIKKCFGVRRGYAEVHGTDELNAL